MTIHFAPLQGYTDKIYRKVYDATFKDVDFFYTPYLSLENSGDVKKTDDILGIGSELKKKTIAQILPADLAELKVLTTLVVEQDFDSINLNMGCPYPMVTNKGRGASLIRKPELVTDFINYISEYTSLQLSLKMRSGLEEHDELFLILDQIPYEKVSSIIIHPRVAKQLYKGKAMVEVFEKCCNTYPEVKFIYNGDIKNYNDFIEKKLRFNGTNDWMIGRGLLENPFLAWQIKNSSAALPYHYEHLLREFMIALFKAIAEDSKDNGHALNRIKNQLNMCLSVNEKYKKFAKKIKKSNDLNSVESLLENLTF